MSLDIEAWLARLPDVYDWTLSQSPSKTTSRKTKRKRSHQQPRRDSLHLPTPPPSQKQSDGRDATAVRACVKRVDDMPAHTPKKRKVDGGIVGAAVEINTYEDAATTPRAGSQNLKVGRDGGSRSSISETVSSSVSLGSGSHHIPRSKSRSRTSSPSKQLRHLSLEDDYSIKVLPLALHDERFPTEARRFASRMASIAGGRGVVDEVFRDIIDKHLSSAEMEDFGEWVYRSTRAEHSPAYDEAQATYALRRMLRIVKLAEECDIDAHEEAGWNVSVHGPLLDLAIEQISDGRVKWLSCTTANIIHTHRRHYPVTTRIDYAFTLNPLPHPPGGNAADEVSRIERNLKLIQRQMPEDSINHTSFEPLCYHPISLSIETKRLDAPVDKKADLQLGLWLAAHGQCLAMSSHTARLHLGNDAPSGDDNQTDETDGDVFNSVLSNWSPPPFLPGVIVQGHTWKLTLATFDVSSGSTTLWKMGRPFGSTDSMLGAMQVMAGLGELIRWSVDELGPWFRGHVLGFTEAG